MLASMLLTSMERKLSCWLRCLLVDWSLRHFDARYLVSMLASTLLALMVLVASWLWTIVLRHSLRLGSLLRLESRFYPSSPGRFDASTLYAWLRCSLRHRSLGVCQSLACFDRLSFEARFNASHFYGSKACLLASLLLAAWSLRHFDAR